MSWRNSDDGAIISDEEFQDACCNCTGFCAEGAISVPCNGDRANCPYFEKIDD